MPLRTHLDLLHSSSVAQSRMAEFKEKIVSFSKLYHSEDCNQAAAIKTTLLYSMKLAMGRAQEISSISKELKLTFMEAGNLLVAVTMLRTRKIAVTRNVSRELHQHWY